MNSAEGLVDGFPEGGSVVLSLGVRVVMADVGTITHRVHVGGVEAVLHLHSSVLGNVNMISPGCVLGVVVLNSHIHVKSLISLLLTILNAFYF